MGHTSILDNKIMSVREGAQKRVLLAFHNILLL